MKTEQAARFKAFVDRVSEPPHGGLATSNYPSTQTTYEDASEAYPAATFEPSEWIQYDNLLRKAWPAIYPGR